MNIFTDGKGYFYKNEYITKEEYEQGLLKDFIKTIYGGSMPKLLSAFVGIHAISEEEAEEIKKILEDK